MRYTIVLGFAALAVALPQGYNYNNNGNYNYNNNGGGRPSYDDRRGGYGYDDRRGPYDDRRGGRNDWSPAGAVGSLAGELTFDFTKGATHALEKGAKGVEKGAKELEKGAKDFGKGAKDFEKGFECGFSRRCKNVVGEDVVPVLENAEAKPEIAPRQLLGNLFGENRLDREDAEAEDAVDSENETESESAPVVELTPGQA